MSSNAQTSQSPNAEKASSTQTSPESLSPSLDADIARLAKLLNQTESMGDSATNPDASLQELLSYLQSADGIASGVELQVDSIISHLDDLLDGLEKEGLQKSVEGDTVSK
ncbi:hypothetical protein PC9H_003072 [Pleurotus ostreatus]|uniref:Uncharacterized protein n=1 Tax=Pleurotus ostreatus TaxID=5322 RepID=A0A8H6ZXP3_PLEOS|nr:uncharacterized protein PC9H_003072 [Pleurotus ostreatus]KAF7436243.1 hypothetical protein PC9H_003072 [Pleurotus ostreatus]